MKRKIAALLLPEFWLEPDAREESFWQQKPPPRRKPQQKLRKPAKPLPRLKRRP